MQTLLNHAADILLMAASLGAAAYCMILSRRLKRLGSFDKGIGSAIAVMSAQVEEMKAALGEAKAGSDGAGRHLNDLVQQAREISAELEMMIAACHDFAETAIEVQSRTGAPPESQDHPAERVEAAPHDDRSHAGVTAAERDAPVFGSRRRRTSEPEPRDDAGAVAMFRHRSTADA